ncbi:MAG: hypothetical protein HYZ75_18245 [Elusimicrobia bacterium]|nr:hypothetical protein [Elusimicrobiota bacterium]
MKAALLLALMALLSSTAEAAAAKRPARPKRPARHRVKVEAPRLTDPTAVSWPRRLKPGRWTPAAADALERLLQHLGEGATGYSRADPPAAVFVLDDAALSGSPGDALLARLTAEAAFSFDESFWKQLPPHYGAARARAGWQSFQGQPRTVWARDPHYLMYRKALHAAYASLCRDAGRKTCARWRAALLTGLDESALQRMARQVVAEALRVPVTPERVGDSPEDPAPTAVTAALRVVPEMLDLVRVLQDRGFDVWVMSASSQYAALEAARLYGVHPTRVVGLRQKVTNGQITPDILQPVPEGAGLAEALTLFLGRPPALAVGRLEDGPLLDYGDGSGLSLLLAEPSTAPPEAARNGWLVQPPFSPVREPQAAVYPPPPGTRPPAEPAPPAPDAAGGP